LQALPAKMIARIMPRLEDLATSPRPRGCKKLKTGHTEWRIRVGDYRIIYEIDDTAKAIEVTSWPLVHSCYSFLAVKDWLRFVRRIVPMM